MGRKRAYALSPKNVQFFEEVDFAIIGSGPSALGLAIRLRKEYPLQKIALFEKNFNVGGGLHTFKLLGETFDSGTHYLGAGAVAAFQKILPPDTCPLFVPLRSPEGCMAASKNVRVYDSLRVNGVQVDLSADHGRGGWESWEKSYLLTFAGEEKRIRRFRRLLETVSGPGAQVFFALRALPSCFSLHGDRSCVNRLFQFCFPEFARLSRLTLQEALLQCGIQPHSKLGTLLCAQGGNYGLPPSEAGFLMHAAMVKHYAMEGAFMPEKGCQALVDACVHHLQEAGNARLFMGAEVYRVGHGSGPTGGLSYTLDVLKKKPNLAEERATERYRFKARNLVVATSFLNVDGLIPPSLFQKRRQEEKRGGRKEKREEGKEKREEGKENQGQKRPLLDQERTAFEKETSGSFVFLFCTLRKRENSPAGTGSAKGSDVSVEVSNELFGNVWVHPVGWDLESAHRMRQICPAGKSAPMSFLVSRRGMKITVIGTAEWKWCRQILPKGSAEETAWRACMTENLLAALDRSGVLPVAPGKKVRDYVERYRLGTPLCIRKFLAARRGNAYGSKHTPPRFCNIGHVTANVCVHKDGSGMWRTGQDVVTAGVAGALASAEVTFLSIKLAKVASSLQKTKKWIPFVGRAAVFAGLIVVWASVD